MSDEEQPEVEVHPLFAEAREGKGPLPEPIGSIDVKRVRKDGSTPTIAVVAAEELGAEEDVQKRWGPGRYLLIGRNERRSRILARCKVECELEGVEADAAEPGEGAAAPAALAAKGADPLALLIAMLSQQNQHQAAELTALRTQMLKSTSDSSAAIISAISQLTGARLADQREMIAALVKGRSDGGGAASFKEGLEQGIAFASALNDGGDPAELINAFTQGIGALKDLDGSNKKNGAA